MSHTDFLQLSEHKFFSQLRSSLPKASASTKASSLIAVCDDMLYAWDARDNCVLALNIKTVRLHEGENIPHQTLLPYSPPLFTPDRLIVNESNSLLAACGANGVLVFELPSLTPPYGTFYNNKDVNYVRTHSLHERALAFSTKIEVRQVRFHPGSTRDNHVCLLTNDNVFRVFCIENSTVIPQGVFKVGPSITCAVPSSSMSMQEALGEVAVDFDFGPPEITARPKSLTKKDLKWPVYFLAGDATVHMVTITLGDKTQPEVFGPFKICPLPDGKMNSEYCSIAVFRTTPPVMAVANCNGHISHVLVLDDHANENGKKKNKILMLLETLELELGYTVGNYSKDSEYSCPIYLHKDAGRLGNYFATHETGVHSVEMGCVDFLHKLADDKEDDFEEALEGIVNEQSSIYYLLCTKTSEDRLANNPVIGFALYYNRYSFLCLLANGQLVTLPIETSSLPQEDIDDYDVETMSSPLKILHNNQFDLQIQRLLKQGTAQPILKLSSSETKTQQDSYELSQRSALSLREQFANYERARVEIEKRVRSLTLLKEYQLKELNKMNEARVELQENAERLAEKYEDLNDRQIKITNRCQKLLISISKHQDVPSNAEKEFHVNVKKNELKIDDFSDAIDKLRRKIKYQECKIKNYQVQTQKNQELSRDQSESFKNSLHETTRKISEMMKEVTQYKNQLNIQ